MRYRDAPAAITWLCDVLGFTRHAVYDGPNGTIAHAELAFGTGMIMLGSASNANPYPQTMAHPDETGGRITSPVYLIVPDCNPVWGRVQAAGVDVLAPLRTMSYGGQSFTLRDPEGYVWSVGEYSPWQTEQDATQKQK